MGQDSMKVYHKPKEKILIMLFGYVLFAPQLLTKIQTLSQRHY